MAKLITSITLPSVKNFNDTAMLKERLQCKKIPGFHLYKNLKGSCYRFRYTDIEGKVKNKVIGNTNELKPVEAAAIASEIRASGSDPILEKEDRKKKHFEQKLLSEHRTLGNYLNGLYSKHQERKRSGRETLNMIRKNFAHLFDRDMVLINVMDIKQWQLRREKEVKFPTIQRAYGALKTLLNKAVEDGFLESNPLPSNTPLERPHFVEIDKQLQGQEKRRLLTPDELSGLFQGIEAYNDVLKRQRANSIQRGRKYLEPLDGKRFAHWSIPLTYMAYFTGMRVGDIKALTWQNLNLNFKRLTFTPSKTRHHADPISVTLDLPDDIIGLMKQWHEELGSPTSGMVFPTETGKPLDKKAHLSHWNKIRRLGDLPEGLDFYSLRHHWISTLVQTENLLQVARMAGHKSTKMLEKHYAHLIPDRAKGALRAFMLPINDTSKEDTK